MPLINYKVEWKIKWRKHSDLASASAESVDANSDIIFAIKAESCMSLVSLYQQKITKNCQLTEQKLWKISLLEWI